MNCPHCLRSFETEETNLIPALRISGDDLIKAQKPFFIVFILFVVYAFVAVLFVSPESDPFVNMAFLVIGVILAALNFLFALNGFSGPPTSSTRTS